MGRIFPKPDKLNFLPLVAPLSSNTPCNSEIIITVNKGVSTYKSEASKPVKIQSP